jgi:hypothetical protein
MRWLDPRFWLLRVVLLLILLIVVIRAALGDHSASIVLRAPDGARLELTLDDCNDRIVLNQVPLLARPSARAARGAPGPACWYPDPEVSEIVVVTRKGAVRLPLTYLAREYKV